MRNSILWTILLVAVIGMPSACSGGNYEDANAVLGEFTDATEAYVKAMEKADGAAATADAVDGFAAAIEKIAPQMKKIAEKYPELNDQTHTPDELKATRERMDAMEGKMGGAMMKSMAHMQDPKVRKAQQRLQKAMMLMSN